MPGLRRRVPGSLIGWTGTVLFAVVANAAICGALSTPSARLGARVIWVIPLTAIALFSTIHYGSRSSHEAQMR